MNDLQGGQVGWSGRPLQRREDDGLLRGLAPFVADLPRGDALHVVFVRSMHAHGRLVEIQAKAARSLPGVVGVFTATDLPSFDSLPVNPICEAQPFHNPVLADAAVFYVGQPIAMVVGQTLEAAVAAAEQVVCEVDALPPVIGLEQARALPAFIPGWNNNRAYQQRWCAGSFDDAAREAQAVVEVVVKAPRLAPTALEPRGFLARWENDTLLCHLPSQAPHRARQTLARMLGLKDSQLHVVCPRVGGAFGGRASLYPEEVAVAWACQHLQKAVYWQSSRGDDLISATHGRASHLKAWGAFSSDGQLLAMRAALTFDLGSWAPFSALIPGWNAGRVLPGPYSVPVVEVVSEGYVTNTAGVGIYRGAGRPEAAMAMERLMDAGARRLGLDPLRIRERNLPADSDTPVRSATGLSRQGCHPRGVLAQAVQRADYLALKAEVAQRRAAGACIGIGINLYVEPCGSGWESARITALPDGRFLLASGSSGQGQGHDTAFAQVAADALGVPIHRIDVIEADSRQAPEGIGALASRSMAIGGSAVLKAAQRLAALLAEHPGGDPSRDGSGEAQASDLPESGLSVTEVYTTPAEAWSAGCCIALVQVDRQTGSVSLDRAIWVDECGEVINPLLADGQLMGGFAQGYGEAFCESIRYDSDGQIVTGSLMDYALPRADDLICLEISHFFPTQAPPQDARPGASQAIRNRRASAGLPNPLGVSGVGESGSIAAPAALVNAVIDAVSNTVDGHCIELPLKPETIWRMIQKKHA